MKVKVCQILTIILRLIQLLLGAVAIALLVTNSDFPVSNPYFPVHGIYLSMLVDSRVLSFLICTSTYFTASFLLLIATIHRDSFEHMRKSIFEMIYNMSGAIIQGSTSIVIMAVNQSVSRDYGDLLIAPGVINVINAAFYFATFFIAMKARQAT